MATQDVSSYSVDPAAVFGAAISLWNACHQVERRESEIDLSDAYSGWDELMRIVLSIGTRFEGWACRHIDFGELHDLWPYLLEEKFGPTCLTVMLPDKLDHFDDECCLEIAMKLRVPIKLSPGLPVPVEVRIRNTVPESGFIEYRIQTVRTTSDLESVVQYRLDDVPYDNNYGDPYFGVYGVDKDGLLEHVADRDSYADAVSLVKKLAPGSLFPKIPKVEP